MVRTAKAKRAAEAGLSEGKPVIIGRRTAMLPPMQTFQSPNSPRMPCSVTDRSMEFRRKELVQR